MLVALAAISLRIVFAWTSLDLLPATSDEASSVQLAKMIADGARPLLFIGQPYQFPIESYLMAPFVDWMPANAFGARYQALLLGVLTTGVMLYTAYLLFPAGRRWPSWLLILLPSAYWLQHQVGYTPPQYAMTALLVSLVFLFASLAIRYADRSRYFLLVGLFTGLLISNHMLGLSVAAGATSIVVMQAVRDKNIKSLSRFVAGVVVGLLPYFLAIATIEGAYEGVTDNVPGLQAWQTLYDYTLTQTLPGVLGMQPVLFTDIFIHLEWGGSLRLPMLLMLGAILLLIALSRLQHSFVSVANRQVPVLDPVDMFVIAVVLAVAMFAFSSRAYVQGYRFLLVVTWCFPFLIGYLYVKGHSVVRKVIAAFAIAYASFNLVASVDMIRKWSDHEEGVKAYADTPDLRPLLDHLVNNNIDRCYASFWIAYRITFESDGDIVCVQPFNERFMNWPLAGNYDHHEQAGIPYIVMDSNRSELNTGIFKFHLGRSGIEYRQTDIGSFSLFDNFSHPGATNERLLPFSAYRVMSLDGPGSDIKAMHDGDISTYWLSEEKQKKWSGFEVVLDEPQTIERITLRFNEEAVVLPKMIWVYALIDGEWQLVKKIWHKLTPIDFYKHGKVLYEGYQKIVRLDSLPPITALRLKNAIPDYDQHWSIAELELGVRDEDADEQVEPDDGSRGRSRTDTPEGTKF